MALLSISGGIPSEDWRSELGFLALVASLRSPSRPVPARVAGLWPDAGAQRMVEVDGAILRAAADRVTAAVSELAAARHHSVT
jgi:hypothetical protein